MANKYTSLLIDDLEAMVDNHADDLMVLRDITATLRNRKPRKRNALLLERIKRLMAKATEKMAGKERRPRGTLHPVGVPHQAEEPNRCQLPMIA